MTNKEYALTVDAIARALHELETVRELISEIGPFEMSDRLANKLDCARVRYQALRDLGDTLAIPYTAVAERADELKG